MELGRLVFAALGVKLRASHMLNKHSTTIKVLIKALNKTEILFIKSTD
jgi:hypothetical protein